MKRKYYLVYKIINKLNNMIYIGCHVTTNINDRYMGSGTNIRKAIKQYGLENFDKQILYSFDNEIDMLKKEEELVNREFISENSNYNIIVGGKQYLALDTVTVRDKDGNCSQVHKNDERYLSGELISAVKGHISVQDINNNIYRIYKNDERYLSGELITLNKGKVLVKDIKGNALLIDKNDERYLSGELLSYSKDKVLVKDKYGNNFMINVNDERYLSGELNHFWCGKKHSDESKRKIGEKNSINQIGEKNSQYGTCWITKEGKNMKIKKELLEDYLKNNWIKGRK